MAVSAAVPGCARERWSTCKKLQMFPPPGPWSPNGSNAILSNPLTPLFSRYHQPPLLVPVFLFLIIFATSHYFRLRSAALSAISLLIAPLFFLCRLSRSGGVTNRLARMGVPANVASHKLLLHRLSRASHIHSGCETTPRLRRDCGLWRPFLPEDISAVRTIWLLVQVKKLG